MEYEIHSDRLAVTVSDAGGEMISLRCDGVERLWQNDNDSGWREHAPLLFPVAGHVKAIFDGKEYPLPAHGFAKRMTFTLAQKSADAVSLFITDTEETKKVYPFSFRFTVTYRVAGDTLTIDETVENTGASPLPYFLGGHESYKTFAPIEKCKIVFPEEETLATLLLTPDGGYLSGEEKFVAKGKVLPLPADYLADNRTLIFKNIRSTFVTLVGKNDRPLARVTLGDMKNLLLWRPDGAEEICVEPWYGLPDTVGADDTPFAEKYGCVTVAPGEKHTTVRSITYQ